MKAVPARVAGRAVAWGAARRRGGGLAPGLLAIGRGCIAALLVVVTVVGTMALAAVPFAWILVISKLIDVYTLSPLVALPALPVAIIASMIAGLKLLLRVSDLYERLRGHDGPTARLAPVWRRGLTDTGRVSRVRMLDIVMVIAACVAIVALCIWFIALGGSTVRL